MKNLTHIAARFVNTPLMIHPPKLEVIIKGIGPRLGITPDMIMAYRATIDPPDRLAARYQEPVDDRDYGVIDGVAVIPVQGTLLKKETWMSSWSGATSYEQIEKQLATAMNDGGVRGVLLDIDSPGGEVAGCFELADFIYSLRSTKPVYAAANDIALSAAYAIASAASKIFVTRSGAVGSIGVYALHMEQSGFDKDVGVTYTYVFAGEKKVDGNPHEPLADRAKGDMQEEVEREYGLFTEMVARNRKAEVKQIVGTKAGLFWAENGVPLLADQVGAIDDALDALRQSFGSARTFKAAQAATQTTGEPMPETTESKAALAAKKDDEAEPDAKKGKQEDAKPCDGKGEKKDDNDGDDAKKAAALAAVAAPLTGMRAETDIQAISALCKMAGCPERAAEFLTKKKSNGQYFSVAEVSEVVTNIRVEESEKRMITSHVDPHKNGPARMQDLEAEAKSFAAQNKGRLTPSLYVAGSETRMTAERAYAQELESHPEIYEAFRKRHNGAELVRRLQDAGYELVQRG